MSKKLFIGGLDPSTSEDRVYDHFQRFGQVEDVHLPKDRDSGRRKNFGFVTFKHENDAACCMDECEQNIDGKECSVKVANAPRGDRGGGGGGRSYGGGGGGGRSYGGGSYGGGGGRSFGGGGRSGGGGGGACYKCGESGHFARECDNGNMGDGGRGGRGGGGGGGGGGCFECGESGHFARECPNKSGGGYGGRGGRDDRRSRPY